MERALAAAGLPRRPAEAPLEYLERALVDLDATAASARRLTDLFRFAKFSDHPVDAAGEGGRDRRARGRPRRAAGPRVRTFAGFALTADGRARRGARAPARAGGARDRGLRARARRGDARSRSSRRPAARRRSPPSFERALRSQPPPRPARPLELERLEREVTLGIGGAFHLRHKLLPQLREIAAQRLADRRGAALTDATVSADAWELLRPEGPDDYRERYGRGVPIERLEALTDELERI